METTRRGFLQGVLATFVIAQVPASALIPDPVPYPQIDPFDIKPPDGTTFQWVRCALLGEPDPENVQKRLDNGWTFVSPNMYPGAPVSTVEKAIETKGLILMEKPTEDVMLDLASQRAPHMDADYRVWQLVREEMQALEEKISPRLKHIGYTPWDVQLFMRRRLSVSTVMAAPALPPVRPS